jgi:hypothetical protein
MSSNCTAPAATHKKKRIIYVLVDPEKALQKFDPGSIRLHRAIGQGTMEESG